MVRVGSRYVYNVEIRVGDELGVGTVCFGGAWSLDIFEELLGSGDGGRRCCCGNNVLNITDFPSERVREQVFGKR